MPPPRSEERVLAGPEELATAGAELVAGLIRERVARAGACHLVLSGGSTPAGLYRHLARPPYTGRIAWDRVHLFWGDERCLPPDHPQSNFRLAKEALLDQIQAPAANLHRMPGELGPEDGSEAYHQKLVAFFGEQAAVPAFDLVLLGLGPDGHTASLFPGRPLEDPRGRWVMGADPGETEPRVPRITLTLTAINAARTVLFLVSGAPKAGIVAAVRAGGPAAAAYPAARVRPAGDLVWLLDRPAAGG